MAIQQRSVENCIKKATKFEVGEIRNEFDQIEGGKDSQRKTSDPGSSVEERLNSGII